MNFRPIYHFTPLKNFMNDPNGLVYVNGEYHLFYQYNPLGVTWGHLCWGHATSKDYLQWSHQPIALYEENGVMIFSGSAVVDENNTTGFRQNGERNQPAPIIAVYTGASPQLQTQNLAFSLDNGHTWTKYSGNPILDIGSNNFRDPKIFWHSPTQSWVMVVALAKQHILSIYTSPDLLNWTFKNNFNPGGLFEDNWECPDLFELPIQAETGHAWVIKIDCDTGWYFIGDFDGSTFTATQPPEHIDYGPDFYACQTWSHLPPGQHSLIGWMANWHYAKFLPTNPWRGIMTIPRKICLRRFPAGLRLVQQPIETLNLRRQMLQEKGPLIGEKTLPINGTALEILVRFEISSATEFGLRVRVGAGESTVIGCNPTSGQLFVDRRKAGDASFDPSFAAVFKAPLTIENGCVSLHILVDSCSVEVFSMEGSSVISCLIFPDEKSQGISVFASGGSVNLINLQIWKLDNQ
jgi:fructan beta-fructosidase